MTMNFAKHESFTNTLQPSRCGTASYSPRADRPLVAEGNHRDLFPLTRDRSIRSPEASERPRIPLRGRLVYGVRKRNSY
jgi:hypothetical protein